jgi:hypothetical protein
MQAGARLVYQPPTPVRRAAVGDKYDRAPEHRENCGVRIFGIKHRCAWSLARVSDDMVLKQRYEKLAQEFAQNAGDERETR